MNPAEELIKYANRCILPKLSRNIEEVDNHPEFYECKKNLDTNFPPLLDIIAKNDLRDDPEFTKTIMPTVLILYLERYTPRPWNDEKSLEYARKLNRSFQSAYRMSLERVFLSEDFCNIQDVFDNVLESINIKLTAQDFKKYPGLIIAYYFISTSLKDFKLTYNPVSLFPVSLLLVEDYVPANRMRGLFCCSAILKCLDEKHFQQGNYYEVIFSCLKKIMTEKKLEVTKLVHECLLEFIRVLPAEAKESKTDEIFALILEQIHMETNLHRKTVCFSFMKEIISIHKVNCVNKRLLKTVLCDNISICCNDAVADILLVDVIQTLQVWVTYCWCVWRFSIDHKILSALIKLLYVSRKEKIAIEIQDLIVSLISLCSKEERNEVYKNLEQSEITVPEFQDKLEQIKKDILE